MSVAVPEPVSLQVGTPSAKRLRLVDALRALAASLIAWHHFAFYEPLSDQAMQAGPWAAGLVNWLFAYGSVTQVFFVLGGFVVDRSMSRREWRVRDVGPFVVSRYCRLGMPYLATIALAVAACAWARPWVPQRVAGEPVTLAQIAAHVFFLQDILGYDNVSTGLWYVCIYVQILLIWLALLIARDGLSRRMPALAGTAWIDLPIVAGWPLSLAGMFYFNRHPQWDMWAVYFFFYFFLGVLVNRALRGRVPERMFFLFALLMLGAIGYDIYDFASGSGQAAFELRHRLILALATALVVFVGGKRGVLTTWPKSRIVEYLGRTSYSFFLVHFSVFVVVEAVWARRGWSGPWISIAGLMMAYFASLGVAAVFFRVVEAPSSRLARRLARETG